MPKRKHYTAEFKTRVVLELLTVQKGLMQASRDYGIKDTILSRWKQEFLERAPHLFSGEQVDNHKHRSGVEGCLSALVRGNGMRVSRYTGNQKRHMQALFSGAAANLKRVAHWLTGDRPVRYHQSWTLKPTPT